MAENKRNNGRMIKVTRIVGGIIQTNEVHERIWKARLQPWQKQGWVEVAAEAPVEAKVKGKKSEE